MRIIYWKDNQPRKYHIIDPATNEGDITRAEWQELSKVQYIPRISDNSKIVLFEGLSVEPDKRCVFKNEDGYVSTSNWVGVISSGEKSSDIKVKISSRFDNGQQQYFLLYLLSKVYRFNIYDNRINSDRDYSFNAVIVILFLVKLEEAFSDGLFKQYKEIEHNDYNIKGSIDFARHIKLNVPFTGKTAYVNRELSYDNDILCLIRQTLEFVQSKYPQLTESYLSNHGDFYEIETVLEEATPSYNNSCAYNLSTTCLREITNPLYRSYEIVRLLSLSILQEESDHFYQENNQDGLSILFDISWLWEEFVWSSLLESSKYDHLGRKIKNEGSKIGGIRYSEKANSWYPDFIEKNKTGANNYLGSKVLDAKYKSWDYNREDMQQLISYLYITGGTECGAIFPIQKSRLQMAGSGVFSEYRELNEYNAVCKGGPLPRCYKLPFEVPEYDSSMDYYDFCAQMETNILNWKNAAKVINIL